MTDIPRTYNRKWPYQIPNGHWIDSDGWEVWIKDGKYHRTDGPAVMPGADSSEWWLNDKHYSFNEWLEENDEITDNQKVLLKLKYG